MPGLPEKIDVHSHYIPSAYRRHCEEVRRDGFDGIPSLPVGSQSSPFLPKNSRLPKIKDMGH